MNSTYCVVARFATGKSRASLSQCAACRQLRGGVFPSQRRHLPAHFRPPPTCMIAAAAASATAGLLPKTCRQNEKKSADECAAMVEGVESRVTRPQHSAARASNTQSLQGCGGGCMPLRGGEAVPSDGLCSVLRNTLAVLKHVAQVGMSGSMPLRR